jgi:hypothetical protein
MRDFEDILDSLDLEVDDNSILPPPNTKEVSICVFCSGKIIDNAKFDILKFSVFEEEDHDYHCSSCGLKYKFLPKAKVVK